MKDYEIQKLTKLEVAEDHICSAIKLLFDDLHPASAHLLASAADQIIHDLQHDGSHEYTMYSNSARGQFLLHIKDEYHQEAMKLFNNDYNFMKHADQDRSEILEFKPEGTEILLVLTIKGYESLTSDPPPEMRTYFSWFAASYPHMLKLEFEPADTLRSDSNFVKELAREKRLRLGKIMLEEGEISSDRVALRILEEVVESPSYPMSTKVPLA